ncbi:hypothetical protein J7M28_01995 [bacterium]|nr:hypothetical protein [bacterium]
MDKAVGAEIYYRVTERLFKGLSHEAIWGPEGIQPLKRFKEGETAFVASCPNPKHQGAKQTFMLPKAGSSAVCRMCGYRSNWLRAAVKKTGGSLQDGIALLAEKTGIDTSSLGLSSDDMKMMEATTSKLFIFGLLDQYFAKAFQRSTAPAIVAAKAYFKEMGLTERALMSFPVGFYTTQKDIRQHLARQDVSENEMNAAGVLSGEIESNCPFLYAYEDGQGNVVGYVGTDPSNEEARSPFPGFTEDLQEYAMFGLSQAASMIMSERSVWLSALEIDTISIQYESNRTFKIFKQMVSLGRGFAPTKVKIESLRKLGAESFTFISPISRYGREQTSRFGTIISELGIKADVLPLPESEDSLCDLVKDRGFDYFDKSIMSKSGLYSIGRWVGKELLDRYDLTNEAETAKARRDAARASLSLVEEDSKELVTSVGDRIKWDPHFWCIVIEQMKKGEPGRDIEKQVEDVVSQMETKRRDDIEMGFSWSVSADDLEEVAIVSVSEDELMRSFYNPREVLDSYEASRPGLTTGLAALDEYVSLRAGEMTLISGLPGTGKTTFCIHLISHILRNYDDSVLYFSFENRRMAVFNMLISNVFEIPHGEIVGKRLEAGGSMYQKYLNAVDEFTRYRDKLVVVEEPIHTQYCASDIQEICQMVSDNINISLILVDSIGMLSRDKTSPIENETQLAYAMKELQQGAARVKAPVVVTKTPWLAHVRAPGGEVAEPALSISPRVEPYMSIVLCTHFVPYSKSGETGAHGGEIDRLVIDVQKNSTGKMPRRALEVGFQPEYRRLVDLDK